MRPAIVEIAGRSVAGDQSPLQAADPADRQLTSGRGCSLPREMLPARGLPATAEFTGRREGDRLETVWHVVSTDKPWPHAVQTNADTFQRLD